VTTYSFLFGSKEAKYTSANSSQYVSKLRNAVFLEGQGEFVAKKNDAYEDEREWNRLSFHVHQGTDTTLHYKCALFRRQKRLLKRGASFCQPIE
jgi:hypothetical protein